MLRFRSRAQYQAALTGPTVARTPHFALHFQALPVAVPSSAVAAPPVFHPPAVWVGAMVPKRWARRAVTRSTIKRLIFTVSASFEPRLPQGAHVVRLRAGFDRQRFPSASSDALRTAVRQELSQLFGQAAERLAA